MFFEAVKCSVEDEIRQAEQTLSAYGDDVSQADHPCEHISFRSLTCLRTSHTNAPIPLFLPKLAFNVHGITRQDDNTARQGTTHIPWHVQPACGEVQKEVIGDEDFDTKHYIKTESNGLGIVWKDVVSGEVGTRYERSIPDEGC